jgi:hypothetical protein
MSAYLNNVCSIEAVNAVNSENTLLLAKYSLIRDPEITRKYLEFRRKMFGVSERTLVFQMFFPYYRSGSEYFHILNRSLNQRSYGNSNFNLLHALRLRMKIIFAVSEFGTSNVVKFTHR